MEQDKDVRRRRINRLKRIIIATFLLVWILPCILCLVLFSRVKEQNNRLDSIHAELMQVLENHDKEAMSRAEYDKALAALEERLSELESHTILAGTVELEKTGALQQNPVDSLETETVQEEPASEEVAHKVYLTFDDGPSIYTQDILDVLREKDVKATFFVNGKKADWADEALKRIVEEGHTLGMHSYSHVYDSVYESVEEFAADYEKIHQHILEITGYDSRIYRFPGGSSNRISKVDMMEFAKYLEERDTVYFDWNISSMDATGVKLSVDSIVNNCTKDIDKFDTCVILCHDAQSKSTTVEALPLIIDKIKNMGDAEFYPITEETPLIQHRKPESVEN